MENRETVEWIKNQMKAGYKRDVLKNSLTENGYDTDYAEKLIKHAENEKCTSMEKKENVKPHINETTNEKNNGSWIKTGIYAAMCIFVPLFLILFNSAFFDNYGLINTVTITTYIFAEIVLVANRARGYSFSKISGSIIVARIISAIGLLAMNLIYQSYLLGVDINEINKITDVAIKYYSHISPIILIAGIITFIISILISGGLTLLARKIMEKKNIGEFKILKPILIIAIINIAIVIAYSMSGPKIELEPVDASWCDTCDNDFINQERTYDMGCEGVTGYNTDTYFKATPRINDRFESNKYKLATMLIAMMNNAAIGMNAINTENLVDGSNLTDQYYEEVIRNTDFDFEIRSKEREQAITIIFDSLESFLLNQRKFILENEIRYEDKDGFESKEIHIRFIDAKISIIQGLRKRYEILDIDLGKDGMSLLSAANSCARTMISSYYDFIEHQSKIEIIEVDISNTSVQKQVKVEVTIKNDGIQEYNISDIKIDMFVNKNRIDEVICDFEVIDVNQIGKCFGYAEKDKEMNKTIKVSPRNGFGDEITY